MNQMANICDRLGADIMMVMGSGVIHELAKIPLSVSGSGSV